MSDEHLLMNSEADSGSPVRAEILDRLAAIEREEQVHIFYACESGSRAWGFPSADSDYDVRFLYLRSRDWYLSIDVEEKRDVIERPISDDLDLSGWDLRKALKLLRKSNPPLLEWLASPIVYRQNPIITGGLKNLAPDFYSPIACAQHYLHMARGNYREYLRGDVIRVKKYFYVLRPLLAIKWIERESDVMPMEFGTLVEKSIESPELRAAIEDLLRRKRAGQEMDSGPRVPVISEFIEQELRRIEAKLSAGVGEKSAREKLNEFFRAALTEVDPGRNSAGTISDENL